MEIESTGTFGEVRTRELLPSKADVGWISNMLMSAFEISCEIRTYDFLPSRASAGVRLDPMNLCLLQQMLGEIQTNELLPSKANAGNTWMSAF